MEHNLEETVTWHALACPAWPLQGLLNLAFPIASTIAACCIPSHGNCHPCNTFKTSAQSLLYPRAHLQEVNVAWVPAGEARAYAAGDNRLQLVNYLGPAEQKN